MVFTRGAPTDPTFVYPANLAEGFLTDRTSISTIDTDISTTESALFRMIRA